MPEPQFGLSKELKLSPTPPRYPTAGKGESDCIIGPFSSKGVAEYFAQANEETRYDSIMKRVFPNGRRLVCRSGGVRKLRQKKSKI